MKKPISLPKKMSSMQVMEMIQVPASQIEEARSVAVRKRFSLHEQLINSSYIITRTA
jgi:hypothetical protein